MRWPFFVVVCAACATTDPVVPVHTAPPSSSVVADPALATDDAEVRRRALAWLAGMPAARIDDPLVRARWRTVLAHDLARLDPHHDASRALVAQLCVLQAAMSGVPLPSCDRVAPALDALDPRADLLVRAACVDVLAAGLDDHAAAVAARRTFALHAGDALETVAVAPAADLATSFVYRRVALDRWSYRTVRLALTFDAGDPALTAALDHAPRWRCRRLHGVLEQRAFRPHTHAPIAYAPSVFRGDLTTRPDLLGPEPEVPCASVPRGRALEPEWLALVRASVPDPDRYLSVTEFTDHDWDVVRDTDGVPRRRVRIVSVYVRDEY